MADNELYRGYTIVTMVDSEYNVKIMASDVEYLMQEFVSHEDAKDFLDVEIRNNRLMDLSLPRVSVGVSDSNDLQLVVNTPGGNIVVKSVGGGEYPDASIFIGEHCVGFIEWNPDEEQFNFHYYGTNDDDAIQTFHDVTEIHKYQLNEKE